MPNIFKRGSQPKTQPYIFPKAEDIIITRSEATPLEEEETGQDPEAVESPEESEESTDRTEEKLQKLAEDEPISYAQIQAEQIMKDARRQADELLEQTRANAKKEAEAIFDQARREGYEEGYMQGSAKALEDGVRAQEEQAAIMGEEVQHFLERASEALDRQLDDNVAELRDLAMAIAEKVVCISLKSSTEVISRMIQTAVDKKKHREWVHIYIAECDARRMAQIPQTLSATLSALADRVRIIPMTGEDSGTCIIEMPDEIIDASAGTQLNNIRNILMDTPTAGPGISLY